MNCNSEKSLKLLRVVFIFLFSVVNRRHILPPTTRPTRQSSNIYTISKIITMAGVLLLRQPFQMSEITMAGVLLLRQPFQMSEITMAGV
jgi:hypothetical protein